MRAVGDAMLEMIGLVGFGGTRGRVQRQQLSHFHCQTNGGAPRTTVGQDASRCRVPWVSSTSPWLIQPFRARRNGRRGWFGRAAMGGKQTTLVVRARKDEERERGE